MTDESVEGNPGAWTGTGLAETVVGTREQFDRDLRERFCRLLSEK